MRAAMEDIRAERMMALTPEELEQWEATGELPLPSKPDSQRSDAPRRKTTPALLSAASRYWGCPRPLPPSLWLHPSLLLPLVSCRARPSSRC